MTRSFVSESEVRQLYHVLQCVIYGLFFLESKKSPEACLCVAASAKAGWFSRMSKSKKLR